MVVTVYRVHSKGNAHPAPSLVKCECECETRAVFAATALSFKSIHIFAFNVATANSMLLLVHVYCMYHVCMHRSNAIKTGDRFQLFEQLWKMSTVNRHKFNINYVAPETNTLNHMGPMHGVQVFVRMQKALLGDIRTRENSLFRSEEE